MKKQSKYWQDYILLPLLTIFWRPFVKKQSYCWQWRDFDKNFVTGLSVNQRKIIAVDKDPKAKSRQGFWNNFYQTNFGWQKVAVVESARADGADVDYQAGFYDADDDICQLCSLIRHGRTGLLVGPHDVKFFLISPDNGEVIPIRLQAIKTKPDLKYPLI